MSMMIATELSSADVYSLSDQGLIGRFANPLVAETSKPENEFVLEKEGRESMNTRMIWVNGKRLTSGVVVNWRGTGTAMDKGLNIVLPGRFAEADGAKNIFVDEFIGGRLIARYEWKTGDVIVQSQDSDSDGKKLSVFKMTKVVSDDFSRA